VLLIGAWGIAAWLPGFALIRLGLSLDPSSSGSGANPPAVAAALELAGRLGSDESVGVLCRTVILGLGVALMLWMVRRGRAFEPGAARSSPALLRVFTRGVPPLVVGLGVLALARIALPGPIVSQPLSSRLASAFLDGPDVLGLLPTSVSMPAPIVLIGVCLFLLPRALLRAAAEPGDRALAVRRADQALVCGASRGQAHRLAWRAGSHPGTAVLVLWATLAATGISPAIVLTATGQGAPLGPVILRMADEPDEARATAASLALVAVLANLSALGWVWSRSRTGSGLANRGFSHEHVIE
jgi:hypothetical protein